MFEEFQATRKGNDLEIHRIVVAEASGEVGR
jgi:hypothetical protein